MRQRRRRRASIRKLLCFIKKGKYDEAYAVYSKLVGYKDVDGILEYDNNIIFAAKAAWRKEFFVGNTIKYGMYEQDNNTTNGKEIIEWEVLQCDGEKALIISKYALEYKAFNEDNAGVTWETCTLRKWLNNEFVTNAFDKEEQSRIEMVKVTADRNPEHETDPGNDTTDKVFLLSCIEANDLFKSDDARTCKATTFAKAQIGQKQDENCIWWLRSPGCDNKYAAYIDRHGSFYRSANYWVNYREAIRPVVMLKIS